MSVLIKGMEMPKNCLECMFRISYWKRALTPSGKIFTYGCMLNGKEINILEKRCKDCPINEIPTPHGRLIDADAVEERLQKYWYEEYPNQEASYHRAFMDSNDCVKDLPTIIEAEVEE